MQPARPPARLCPSAPLPLGHSATRPLGHCHCHCRPAAAAALGDSGPRYRIAVASCDCWARPIAARRMRHSPDAGYALRSSNMAAMSTTNAAPGAHCPPSPNTTPSRPHRLHSAPAPARNQPADQKTPSSSPVHASPTRPDPGRGPRLHKRAIGRLGPQRRAQAPPARDGHRQLHPLQAGRAAQLWPPGTPPPSTASDPPSIAAVPRLLECRRGLILA